MKRASCPQDPGQGRQAHHFGHHPQGRADLRHGDPVRGQEGKTDLPLNKPVEVTYTPKSSGNINFGCAMGMMIGGVLQDEEQSLGRRLAPHHPEVCGRGPVGVGQQLDRVHHRDVQPRRLHALRICMQAAGVAGGDDPGRRCGGWRRSSGRRCGPTARAAPPNRAPALPQQASASSSGTSCRPGNCASSRRGGSLIFWACSRWQGSS